MSKLFSAFNAATKKEWIEKITIDLKGADYDEKLVSDAQGIKIAPIYHDNDNTPTFNSSFPEHWESYQLINAKDPKEGNIRALEALQNDVSGLCFSTPNNLTVLLKGIEIEHIRIDFKDYEAEFINQWEKYRKGKNVKGAFHGIEDTTLLSTIFAKGKTAKEESDTAFIKGILVTFSPSV